jgi:hypothetical protein
MHESQSKESSLSNVNPFFSQLTLSLSLACLLACTPLKAAAPSSSIASENTPARYTPGPSKAPLPAGSNLLYVDPIKGNDKADGKSATPWRSLKHAVSMLKAGDTLLLAGGVYREPLYVAVQGTPEKPITIRSQPGAIAVIDTGFAEFADSPATAWEPVKGSSEEYVSTSAYPNIRDVIGRFVATGHGLQTYWHKTDLLANNEIWAEPKEKGKDIDPIYVGPGIWYNQATGKIHARFAPTHVPGITNYAGSADPRQIPLTIAPFRATPLLIDGASNVTVQDLVIRGGGFEAVQIELGTNIVIDGVTIYCGTYGLRVSNTQGFKFLRSAIMGNAAPWCFRQDNSLRNRPGRGLRDVARLAIHALWVPDSGREFSVYAFPVNTNFEIAYSLFCDSHDGLYLGGVDTKFHHNILENCHDDGLYISPMYPWTPKSDIFIYENLIRGCLTPIAFGAEFPTSDTLYIYRNVIDQRMPVGYSRQSAPGGPSGVMSGASIMGDHGSPEWPKSYVYQNTFLLGKLPRQAQAGLFSVVTKDRPREVYNNLIIFPESPTPYALPKDATGLKADGNFYGQIGMDAKVSGSYFAKARATDAFKASQADANSLAGDAKIPLPELSLVRTLSWTSANSLRPGSDSPAKGAGIVIPADLPDPYRQAGKPDIGAVPADGPALQVGPGAAPSPVSAEVNRK